MLAIGYTPPPPGIGCPADKLDIIANNLANASTTGFKKTRADFHSGPSVRNHSAPPPRQRARGAASQTALQVGLGVRTASSSRAFPGRQINSNPLDLFHRGQRLLPYPSAPTATWPTPATAVSGWMPPAAWSPVGRGGGTGHHIPTDATYIIVNSDGAVQANLPTALTWPISAPSQTATFVNPADWKAIGNICYLATASSGDPSWSSLENKARQHPARQPGSLECVGGRK